MDEILRSFALGTLGLAAAAVLALAMTILRKPNQNPIRQQAVSRIAMIAAAGHLLHSGEEWLTGFAQRFPEFLGLTAWPDQLFVGFNLVWIAIWFVSAKAIPQRWAFFPLWFMAIGFMGNAVAHPLMAASVGGYFPGLVSAPLSGLLGLFVAQRLLSATRH